MAILSYVSQIPRARSERFDIPGELVRHGGGGGGWRRLDAASKSFEKRYWGGCGILASSVPASDDESSKWPETRCATK
jgi:hypothetical protein